MSGVLARVLAPPMAGAALTVFPGYLESTSPRIVQLTGDITLEGLEYVGVAGSLVVGRVLLWTPEPGSRPIILGNLNT